MVVIRQLSLAIGTVMVLTASSPLAQEGTPSGPPAAVPITLEAAIVTLITAYVAPKVPSLIAAIIAWIQSNTEKTKAATSDIVSGSAAFRELNQRIETLEKDNRVLSNRVVVLEDGNRRKESTISALLKEKSDEKLRADELAEKLKVALGERDRAVDRLLQVEADLANRLSAPADEPDDTDL